MRAYPVDLLPGADLTVADRCDRCGAQAYVRVAMISSGAEMLFCAHHYDQNADALARCAVVTTDTRHTLSAG